jgi:DNA-binding phage protein
MTKKTYDYIDLIKKNLSDFKYAKTYYTYTLKDFKEDKDLKSFEFVLNLIFEVQGADNFKKITGFNYDDFTMDSGDIKDLLKLIQVFIMINGKKEVAERSKLTIPTINKIFKPNVNLTIDTLNNLVETLDIKYKLIFKNT